jgi:nucleotide-binding universal stress UspA family protein
MTSILIGVDDSPRSEDAVAFAATLAAASGATVVLACAFPYEDTPSRVSNPDLRVALGAQAEETLRRVAARLEGVDPARVKTVAVASTSAPRALDRLAESQRAELIVVGATHTGHLGRIFPGSTAERLLHGAPCPVAVVPAGYQPPPAGRPAQIGVAYDGSVESVAAVNAATRIALALAGQLRVIGVFEAEVVAGPVVTAGADYLAMREAGEKQARAELDRAAAELPEDVHAQTVFLAGDPVRQLATRSTGLDLMVAGSRGYGPLRAVLLGGVTGRLLRVMECPLIVVPRGHEMPFGALFGSAAARAS